MEALKQLTTIVADYYEVDYYKVFTRKRNRELVKVRQMVMHIARTQSCMTHEEIADFFNLNYATCIHSIKKIDGYLDVDKELKKDYAEIRIRLLKADVQIRRYKEYEASKLCYPMIYATAAA